MVPGHPVEALPDEAERGRDPGHEGSGLDPQDHVPEG